MFTLCDIPQYEQSDSTEVLVEACYDLMVKNPMHNIIMKTVGSSDEEVKRSLARAIDELTEEGSKDYVIYKLNKAYASDLLCRHELGWIHFFNSLGFDPEIVIYDLDDIITYIKIRQTVHYTDNPVYKKFMKLAPNLTDNRYLRINKLSSISANGRPVSISENMMDEIRSSYIVEQHHNCYYIKYAPSIQPISPIISLTATIHRHM